MQLKPLIEKWRSEDGRIIVAEGDITRVRADAIVNAANSTLLGGGGVDGAIHAAGGSAILEDCKRLRASSLRGGLPCGQAVETTAGNLNARFVIHTVGPVWQGGSQGEEGLLASAYRSSLKATERLGCASVAFPAISTGVYGYPSDSADRVALSTIRKWLGGHELPRAVILVFREASRARDFLAANGL